MTPHLDRLTALIADQRRRQRVRLLLAAVAAAAATAAAVFLLGLSGWFITGAALAGLAGAGAAFNVLLPSAAIRLLAILRTACRYVERVSGHEAALKALAALRPILFRNLASAPPEKALSVSSGEVSARLVQDIDAIQTLFVRLSGPWGAVAGAAAAISLAALAGPGAALVTALGLLLSVAGSLFIGRTQVDRAGGEVQIAVGRFKDRLSALEASAAELRAYGLEDWAASDAEAAARDLDQSNIRVSIRAGWITAWQMIAMGMSVVGVFAVSTDRSPPLVALAVLAAVASMEAAAALTTHFRSAGAATQALLRLSELGGDPAPRRAGLETGTPATLGFGSIGLTAAPPSRIAIFGVTGMGKSTLIERLMGLRHFHDPTLTVGGAASHALDALSLRRQFAYAAQEVRLLNATVRTNLRTADPDADDATLWRALEDADLAGRIRQSSAGLDMPLGENGAGLSGGERRRLGLARACLRAAPWLVLDEPTEGLDGECEARVIDGLLRHLERTGQGLIVISHRAAPRRLCSIAIEVAGIDPTGQLTLRLAEQRPDAPEEAAAARLWIRRR